MNGNRSSVLENLRIEGTQAEFALDGRSIRLSGDARSPALSALRELHQHALADYENYQVLAAQRTGIFARLGEWFRRIFERTRTPLIFASPTQPQPYSGISTSTSPDAIQTGELGSIVGQSSTQTVNSNFANLAHLQAVFADERGVHVVWHETRPTVTEVQKRSTARPIQINYSLDSEFARRLQRCYRELAVLGYKTKDLYALTQNTELRPSECARPDALASEIQIGTPSSAPTAATTRTSSAAPPGRASSADEPWWESPADVRSNSSPKNSAPLNSLFATQPSSIPPTSTEIVMRLHPPTADHPPRALVSPADGGVDSAEVLIAPEKVLRALRIAADESHPTAKRLSYLRCARSEKGLQIVAVGFGETSETKPARWEDATTWWMEKGQELGTATEPDRVPDDTSPSVPGPNYSVGTKPLQSFKRSANDRGAHEPEPG